MEKVIKTILAISVVIFACLMLFLSQQIVGFRAFIITSGSMEPTLSSGALIVTQHIRPTTLRTGDIITFIRPDGERTIVTHRIHSISEKGNIVAIHTKGDSNKGIDPWTLAGGGVIGKVIYTIPLWGYAVAFLQTKIGLLIFILLPSSYIIVSEIAFIYTSLKNHHDKHMTSSSTLLIFLALVCSLMAMQHSLTLFSSPVILASNQFMTQVEQKPHVVINEVYYLMDQNHGAKKTDGQNNEWIELFNPTNSAVNLKDWSLTDNSDEATIIHPNVELLPKAFVLLSKDASTWKYWNIDKNAATIELGNNIGDGLDNNGDFIIVKDSGGEEIDRVSWGANTPSGNSIERIFPGFDTDNVTDWHFQSPPSPGR